MHLVKECFCLIAEKSIYKRSHVILVVVLGHTFPVKCLEGKTIAWCKMNEW